MVCQCDSDKYLHRKELEMKLMPKLIASFKKSEFMRYMSLNFNIK
jgi:hypothetical protein